jgi:hypothetical protein
MGAHKSEFERGRDVAFKRKVVAYAARTTLGLRRLVSLVLADHEAQSLVKGHLSELMWHGRSGWFGENCSHEGSC